MTENLVKYRYRSLLLHLFILSLVHCSQAECLDISTTTDNTKELWTGFDILRSAAPRGLLKVALVVMSRMLNDSQLDQVVTLHFFASLYLILQTSSKHTIS